MAYSATVISIMIASPGDVTQERDVIREVIQSWNYVNSKHSGKILMAVGWDTHSSPELGERPQDLINERILKDCDLLIGVFWTKIGTPTGTSLSGTVEEIEKHQQAGKPVMLYFSLTPVVPGSYDENQFKELQKFKEKCKALGLVEEFENLEDFRLKFTRQLPICINENPYIKTIFNQSGPNEIETQPTYAHALRSDTLLAELTEEAKMLLKESSKSERGEIIIFSYMGGRHIQANGKTFGGGSGRENAKWEMALNQLYQQDLVIQRNETYYEVSHKGYALADTLPDFQIPK